MTGRPFRTSLVAFATSAMMCLAPSVSSACCFTRHHANYVAAPVVAAYAPAPACNTCNTCNYVPQVAYRTVYTSVPVTTFRPITTADPCTGCATTVMQPVTAYSMQARLVPYTTYRPVATACCAPAVPACPTGACGAVAAPVAANYYTPAPVVAPAAPCCGGAAPVAPITAAPMTSAPAMSSPANAAPVIAPETQVPNLGTTSYNATPSYYGQAKPAQPIKTAPEVNRNTSPPRSSTIITPSVNPQDRVTARPLPSVYRQASAKFAVPATTVADDSGWHAGH